MRIRNISGSNNLLKARSRASIGNIFGNAGGEQHCFLHDHGKLVAQIGQFIVAHIHPIQ